MVIKNYLFILSLATIIFIGCGSTDTKNANETLPQAEYSLKLGDSIIQVDSITALLRFEDQLNKDIITFKIYCTSSYPITDDLVLEDNKYMRIHAQSIAEVGKHYINESGNNWINSLGYEFSRVSSFGGTKDDKYIMITSLDKENNLISCEVKLKEYNSAVDIMLKQEKKRPVVFVGKNIRFQR